MISSLHIPLVHLRAKFNLLIHFSRIAVREAGKECFQFAWNSHEISGQTPFSFVELSCIGFVESGENDVCGVTVSLYPHWAEQYTL